MSWGLRITFLYLGFVALILTLVFTSMRNKEDLVASDYYAQELKYQERINAIRNSNSLPETISHEVRGRAVELLIPKNLQSPDFSGQIHFFRPSDASLDVKLAMKPDAGGRQVIDAKGFARGIYKMWLSWQSGQKSYFKEETIFIQ